MSLKKIYLEITDECNLNCITCYRSNWTDTFFNMSTEIFEKFLKQIEDCPDLKTIVIGGIGEPLYFKNINNIIEKLKKYEIILTTNGTILDKTLLNTLTSYVNKIVFSIDGVNDTFEKIRGFELDEVIKNINLINKKKNNSLKLAVQFVLSKDNEKEIFKIIDLCSSLNISEIIISNILPQSKNDSEKILYTKHDNKYLKNLFNKIRNYSFLKGLEIKLPNIEIKTERRCDFIENDALFINSLGDIVPCYRLSHNGKEYVFGREKDVLKHSFGNILKKSIKEIYDSKEYTNFKNTIFNNRYPSCIDCDLVDGCDMVKDTEVDCYYVKPSCGDCLWARNIVFCP